MVTVFVVRTSRTMVHTTYTVACQGVASKKHEARAKGWPGCGITVLSRVHVRYPPPTVAAGQRVVSISRGPSLPWFCLAMASFALLWFAVLCYISMFDRNTKREEDNIMPHFSTRLKGQPQIAATNVRNKHSADIWHHRVCI